MFAAKSKPVELVAEHHANTLHRQSDNTISPIFLGDPSNLSNDDKDRLSDQGGDADDEGDERFKRYAKGRGNFVCLQFHLGSINNLRFQRGSSVRKAMKPGWWFLQRLLQIWRSSLNPRRLYLWQVQEACREDELLPFKVT